MLCCIALVQGFSSPTIATSGLRPGLSYWSLSGPKSVRRAFIRGREPAPTRRSLPSSASRSPPPANNRPVPDTTAPAARRPGSRRRALRAISSSTRPRRSRTTNSLNVGCVERQLESARPLAQLLRGVARLLQAQLGRFAQSLRDRAAPGRSSLAGRTGPGSCRCCSWPFRGGCVARGFAA